MKFQFRLEKVLTLRRMEVDVARREFLAAQANAEHARREQEKMEALLQEALRHRIHLSQQGGGVIDELRGLEAYIDGQKVRIRNQTKTVAGFESIAEAKREILKIAVQNQQVLEKLKERKLEQFRVERRKAETKALDDLVSGRSLKRDVR